MILFAPKRLSHNPEYPMAIEKSIKKQASAPLFSASIPQFGHAYLILCNFFVSPALDSGPKPKTNFPKPVVPCTQIHITPRITIYSCVFAKPHIRWSLQQLNPVSVIIHEPTRITELGNEWKKRRLRPPTYSTDIPRVQRQPTPISNENRTHGLCRWFRSNTD